MWSLSNCPSEYIYLVVHFVYILHSNSVKIMIITTSFERDIGRHIFNRLNFNIKRRETLKATHPNIFWRRHWKQSANDNTHTSYTHKELCNHVLEGKKTHQNVSTSTESEGNPQKVLIVAPFKRDSKKVQYA